MPRAHVLLLKSTVLVNMNVYIIDLKLCFSHVSIVGA